MTAIFYTNYRSKALVKEENKLALRDGSCIELRQNKFTVILGIYNFKDPFSIQVPTEKRRVNLKIALKWFTWSAFEQTDYSIWELRRVLIGESAGYLFHGVAGLFPHSTLFNKVDRNYYRLVLIGDYTLVAMDVHGTPRTSVVEFQTGALPITRALKYE